MAYVVDGMQVDSLDTSNLLRANSMRHGIFRLTLCPHFARRD